MTTVESFAPAKINLTLHVTGQRPDGYHLLDSYVVFAGIGDRITARRSRSFSLEITGPFAGNVPSGADNLVLRAARLLDVPARITIEKNLPVAAGIGGGSADAAATLRALSELADRPVPPLEELLALGADVPVCLSAHQTRMRGIGDQLDRISDEPFSWPTILVNPGVPVPTGAVFSALATRDNPPMPDDLFDAQFFEFPDWLAQQRNDLEAPAISLAPIIGKVLEAMRAEPGCRIARMSGSGATCYALFDDAREAGEAVDAIKSAHPDWWVELAIS